MPQLIYLRPDGGEQTIEVRDQTVVIGRLSDSAISVLDSFISRVHCGITCRDQQFFLKDLGSANGTYCNGSRVFEHPLSPGDQIQIGNTALTFEKEGANAILRQVTDVTIAATRDVTGPLNLLSRTSQLPPRAAALLAALLLATASVAQDTTNALPPFARGTLASLDTKTGALQLKTGDTNRTYYITPRTYIFRGEEKFTADKLKPGDLLKLRIVANPSGTVNVVRIKVDTNTTAAPPLTPP